MGDFPQPVWSVRLWSFSWKLKLGELTETAMFTPGLIFHLWTARPDLVVVEDISNLLNSLVAAWYCRMSRIPYLVWGLGRVPGKAPSKLRRVASGFIDWLYRNSAGFICYSRAAQKAYAGYGLPTYWAPNSCLGRPNAAWCESVEAEIGKKYEGDDLALITIGELKKQKRADIILDALAQLRDLKVNVHMIGDGPERKSLENRAQELGLESRITFHGAIYDQRKKQELMRKSGLGVLAGRGGLVLQELMYNGLPVICGQADGTELDHVSNGANGYLIQGSPSAEQISAAVRAFYGLSPQLRRKMALGSLATVNGAYNVESMVNGFLAAFAGTLRPAPVRDAAEILPQRTGEL